MDSWNKEYALNKEEYLKLFDECMQEKQEQNIEFLEKTITDTIGRKHAVACQNGTDALMFSLITLGIKPGDEVLTTNFSWISTASCISMVGATPVFCDIDKETYHMSLNSIKKMYSEKVKAIVYPHLFGNMSDLTEILEFCKEKNIFFIEDAAQALGSSLNGVKAGTQGDLSTISFNANKTIGGIAGGGVVLTDNNEHADTIIKLRKHGNHEILGYNSKMLFFNAKFIDHRLKKLNEYVEKKQAVAKKYDELLKDDVIIQETTNGVNHTYHKYIIRFEDKETRNRVKKRLNANVHYEKPISERPMYDKISHRSDNCINCINTSDTILTLPIDPYLTDEEINKTVNTILASL
jgi:dTDP-4-amino-4,6-dideoxygalactose transaminase|tara:strand:+ start:1512 stop:2564 length:1053 start_codon:yes stop_codon:yes gene_type:complete